MRVIVKICPIVYVIFLMIPLAHCASGILLDNFNNKKQEEAK